MAQASKHCSPNMSVGSSRTRNLKIVMGTETKIEFDETQPGELVLIVLLALFLVLVVGLILG